MAKKGSRLREFEKNNRVLDITGAQEARKKKAKEQAKDKEIKNIKNKNAKGNSTGAKAGNNRKRLNWVRLASIAVSVVFVFVVVMSIKNIFDLKAKEDVLLAKQADLMKMKEDLTMQLDNVNSDQYIEEQARKNLKLVKGNELVFYFPKDMGTEEDE